MKGLILVSLLIVGCGKAAPVSSASAKPSAPSDPGTHTYKIIYSCDHNFLDTSCGTEFHYTVDQGLTSEYVNNYASPNSDDNLTPRLSITITKQHSGKTMRLGSLKNLNDPGLVVASVYRDGVLIEQAGPILPGQTYTFPDLN